MHVASTTRCFSDQTFEQACVSLWDLEFLHLEVVVDDNGQLPLADVISSPEDFTNRYRQATRATLDSIGLTRDLSPDEMVKLCAVCKLLRVAHVTVPASEQGTPFNEEIDRLKKLVSIGVAEGVRVSILTEGGTMTQDPHTAVELCEQVKDLGLTFDPSHYVHTGQDGNILDSMYPYTFHTRLRDTNRDAMQVPLGLGDVDHAKIIASLEKEGYSQAINVDLDPVPLGDSDTRLLELRKTRRMLDTLL